MGHLCSLTQVDGLGINALYEVLVYSILFYSFLFYSIPPSLFYSILLCCVDVFVLFLLYTILYQNYIMGFRIASLTQDPRGKRVEGLGLRM